MSCGLGDKPKPSEVREARKLLISSSEQASPVSSMAKAFVMYSGTQPFMQLSEDRAKTGLHDKAASTNYNAAISVFENLFAVAYADVDVYFNGSSHEPKLTIDGFLGKAKLFPGICADLAMAVQRWTEATCEEKFQDRDDSIRKLAIKL
jgi:hypothetical protein